MFGARDITIACTAFADFARLPLSPVNSVNAISYVDGAGADQTLDAGIYDVWIDGAESSIALKSGENWPANVPGSRITVEASVGAVPDPDVMHAMLLFIDHSFNKREWAKVDDWTTLDSLLCNHIWYA